MITITNSLSPDPIARTGKPIAENTTSLKAQEARLLVELAERKALDAKAERAATASDTSIADTIIRQLGGARRLAMMCGAKNFVSIEKGQGVAFQVGTNAKKVNTVAIRLTADDTYDVSFSRITARASVIKAEYRGAYCDQLADLFESSTGMDLTFASRA